MISFRMFHENQRFLDWFSGSKIVDSQGNPLLVYHGTYSDFDRFDDKQIGSNSEGVATAEFGHWFFHNKTGAGHYKQDNPHANVYQAYLKIVRPYVMQDEEFEKYEEPDNPNLTAGAGNKRRRELIATNHDGIIVPGIQWVCAFSAKQIWKIK